jgi:hypothetical protein
VASLSKARYTIPPIWRQSQQAEQGRDEQEGARLEKGTAVPVFSYDRFSDDASAMIHALCREVGCAPARCRCAVVGQTGTDVAGSTGLHILEPVEAKLLRRA